MAASPPGTLWVEVTQLLRWQGPPTGMPRVVASLLASWLDDPGVRFCRYAAASRGLLEVGRAELRGHLEVIARARPAAPPAPPPPPGPPLPPAPVVERESLKRRLKRRFGPWLPAGLKPAVRRGWRVLGPLLRAARARLRPLPGAVARRLRPRPAPPPPPAPEPPAPPPEPALVLTPADVLFLAEWSWGDLASRDVLERAKRQQGFRQATLVYDATPCACPQFYNAGERQLFRAWLAQTCRTADLVLTISRHSKRDIEGFAAAEGLPCPPVEALRIGDTLLTPDEWAYPIPRLGLAEGDRFVLMVSTLYGRKNHWLAYQGWRRLVEKYGPAEVPKLVLVGSQWRLADDVQALMAGDPLTRGRIVLAREVDDAELAGLYRHCLFSVYPSFYEGWGLPVAESLAFGKPCLASNTSSVPEAGGDLADYCDPVDVPGFVRAAERLLFDADYRAGRERQIRERYRPTGWADCAASLRQSLAARLAAEPPARRRAA
jgi:glycosyltransferase involved in cell wall biosynthesis